MAVVGVAVGGGARRGGARRGAHQHRQEVEVSLLELSRSRTRSMLARTIYTNRSSLIGRYVDMYISERRGAVR